MDSNIDVIEQLEGEQFNPSGNNASGGAMSWISSGFGQFKASPGIWIAMVVIYFVLALVMAMIPFLGGIASNILAPVFIGGFMLASHAHKTGNSVEIGHLFEGFKDKFGSLALVGLFYFIGAIVVGIIVVVIGALFFGGMYAAGSFQGAGAGTAANLMGMGLGAIFVIFLLIMLVAIPLGMCLWLAPALVVFHNVSPFDALMMSFKGTFKNLGNFLLYLLLCFVFGIVATIPLGLGWFVLFPVLMGAPYYAYRDIFLK